MSSISPDTTALASASSPERNRTSRSPGGLPPPVASVAASMVLNPFTTRAPGSRSAVISLADVGLVSMIPNASS